MYYIDRIKTFLLALILLPTLVLGQVTDRGYDGAVDQGWGAWGWFWVILLLAIIGVAIWYAVKAGGARRGGTVRGGRGPGAI